MQPSRVTTLDVPVIGNTNPATITLAPKSIPLRVLIRNVGGAMIFIAHESTAFQDVVSSATNSYRIPPGQEDIFVLAPQQGLFASAQGAGGQISVAISEAIPTFWQES